MNRKNRWLNVVFAFVMVVMMIFTTLPVNLWAAQEETHTNTEETANTSASSEDNMETDETTEDTSTIQDTSAVDSSCATEEKKQSSVKVQSSIEKEKALVRASTEKELAETATEKPKKEKDIEPYSDPADMTVTVTPDSGSAVELTQEGTDLTVDHRTNFKIRIQASFPTSATDKSIKIALPYGMTWCYQSAWYPSYTQIDTSAAWYQELKTPVNTVGMVKSDYEKMDSTGSAKRSLYDGSVTFNFKDGLNTVDFSIGVATMDDMIGITGLDSIKDAIVVSQSYHAGTITTNEKKLSDLKLTGVPSMVTTVGCYGVVLNSDHEMEVPQGATSGNNIYWTARPGTEAADGALTVHDDYAVSFLVPENVGYDQVKQQSSATLPIKITSDSPIKTKAGENLILGTGETYTVPAGMNVFTFKVNPAVDYLPNNTIWHGNFPIVWSFADSSIQVGDKITIQMLDVNMKYHHSDETVSYDKSKLPSFTYKIVGKEEQVFTNVGYVNANSYQGGSISDYKLNRGSQFELGKQEYTAGYFTVGNRGTGDSQAKTIHITYDKKNTGIFGVKEQMIPRNNGVTGMEDTQITNFKVKLWDGNSDSSITSWITMDAQSLETTLRVSQVPGYQENYKGYYLKEIQYDVDTIPAQSSWGSSTSVGGTSFLYYGTVLTDEEQPQNASSQYQCSLEITDQDGTNTNGKQTGFSYTGFTGKIAVGSTFPAFTSTGGPTLVAGSTAKISTVLTLGSADGANLIDEAYMISPYGAPLTDISVSYEQTAKTMYCSVDAQKLQPEITEIPATQELKATYPSARVYKLDFTKISGEQNQYDARLLGVSVATQKAYEETNLSAYGNGSISTWTTRINVTANMHSSVSDPVGNVGGDMGESDGLVWVKMNRPEDDSNVNYVGTGWLKDTFNLTGNKDTLLNSGGNFTIKAMPDVSAISSGKMVSEPDSAYRTYTGNETSLVGANSPVNYKLNVVNYTGKTAKGIEIFFPIPKAGEEWGTNLCPEGPFHFDMVLTGKGAIPDGYKVYFAKEATPGNESTIWNAYTWISADDTGTWTQDDWDQVNFVKVVKSEIVNETNDSLYFDLKVNNASTEQMNTVNVWQPYYLRILDGVTAFRPGEPVATTLVPGKIGGTVWYDSNVNGNIDGGESVLPNTKVELYDEKGTLMQEVVTDQDGKYLFEGIFETTKKKDSVTGEDVDAPLFTVKVLNPTDPSDSSDSDRFVQFTTKSDDTDMKFTAASDQKSATVKNVSSKESDTNLHTDAGLVKKDDPFGNLTVSNTVTGTASKTGKTFDFSVTLGEKLTGTFGDMTFTDGVATFSLEDGQSKTALNLPSGITYQVVETPNIMYETTKSNDQGNIIAKTTTEASFTNHRDISSLILKGTDLPTAKKSFSKDSAKRPDQQTFTFHLEGQDDAPQPAESESTVQGEGDATDFGDITFTKPGTYTYVIKEEKGSKNGYTYDNTVYTYVVTVQEDDGQLVVKNEKIYRGTGDDKLEVTGNEITFTNEYKVTACETLQSDVPAAVKSFSDDSNKRPEAETFTFKMKPLDGAPGSSDDTATVKGSGTAGDFGKITFHQAGTFSYEITEENDGKHGYTYDSSVYVYSMVVEDHDSKLEITSKTITKNNLAVDKVLFCNEYHVDSVNMTGTELPGITKAFSKDSDKRPQEKEFRFVIRPLGDAPASDKATVAVTGAGEAGPFGSVTFTDAGTYKYVITEQQGTENGYVYDKTVYTYEVTIEDQSGVLTVTDHKLFKGSGDQKVAVSGNDITFNNEYHPHPVTVDPPVEKKISGGTPDKQDSFKFSMKAKEKDQPMPAGSQNGEKTVEQKGAGSVEFGEFTYTKEGTYVYEITEKAGANPAYNYDQSVYTINDVVTDHNGDLKVARTITTQDHKKADSCIFTNHYTKPASATETASTTAKTQDSEKNTQRKSMNDKKKHGDTNNGSKTNGKKSGYSKSHKTYRNSKSVADAVEQTGDDMSTNGYGITALLSGIFMFVIVWRKRTRNNEGEGRYN